MKKLLLIIFTLITLQSQSQITEEFNNIGGAGNWVGNNGAGVQNYGGSENYATFNVGSTPYPNSTNIVIRSRLYDYNFCDEIYISFPIEGIIEANYDIMRFQYKNNGSWVTDTSFTGIVDMVYTSGLLPNTLTKFRFKLSTDGSVNTYGSWWNPSAYYYDIASFTVYCASVLPVELISFDGYEYNGNAIIEWVTATEINNDKFELYHSTDAVNWHLINTQLGNGNSNQINKYNVLHPLTNVTNYYILKQIDYNGDYEYSDIIHINVPHIESYEYEYYNILGQPVPETYEGFKVTRLKLQK